MSKFFSDVLTIVNGKNQRAVENPNGKYPIYGSGGIMGYADNYLCDAETVIIGRKGSINKPIFVEEPFWNLDTAFGLVANKTVLLPKYLFYFCVNYDFEKLNKTVTIPSLTKSDLLKIDIDIPSIIIQESVVKKLDSVEKCIELYQMQLQKLDELIKSRFVEMFGDPSTNTLSWIVEPLSYHLTVIGGYAFKSDLFVEDGIPVLRIGNINTGVFRSTNLVFWKDDAQLDRFKMYPGDLVISLTGTVGKNDYGNVCILGNDYDVYYLNQRNAKLELRQTLNKEYLSELLKFREIKQRLTGINRGVRQANISNKDILDLYVPIPPIELQNIFADFVTQVEKQKATVQQSIDKLETLKKSLMQEYFG